MERSPRLLRATRLFVLLASLSACLTCNNFDLNKSSYTPLKVTVTVHSNSVDPVAVNLRPSGELTFDNRDSLPHQMVSVCTELNTGVLPAGASVVIRMPNINESCSYQDQTNANISGRVNLCTEENLLECR